MVWRSLGLSRSSTTRPTGFSMSDNVRRFQAVRTALRKYYPQTDSKRHARHLTTLAGMVAGLVAAGSSHLPKMAQKAPDKTKLESRVKRFSRFIQNEAVTYEAFFMPCARDVVVSLSINQPLLVVFDGSALGRGCAVLMASIIYGKRALPLLRQAGLAPVLAGQTRQKGPFFGRRPPLALRAGAGVGARGDRGHLPGRRRV